MRQVLLYDTTLRDGMQGQGMSLSAQEKVRVVSRLDELGIHLIEAGFPGSNPKEVELFEMLADVELRQAQICAFGMTRRRDLEAAEDEALRLLASGFAPVVTLVGKTWKLHLDKVTKVDPEQNLEMIRDSVAFLRNAGKRVIYDAEHFFDGHRDDAAYALECVRAAADAGAENVTLCDTNGSSLPNQIAESTRAVVAALSASPAGPGRAAEEPAVGAEQPGVDAEQAAVDVGIHTHNDAECGVANSLAAVEVGASLVQGTMNGIGERTGNANLTSILPALQLKLGYECVSDEQLARLTETAHFLDELLNLTPHPDQPYVGRNAFAHKGGMHVAGVNADARTFEHMDPTLVGNERDLVVSELSGKGTVLSRAEQAGVPLDEEEAARALRTLKEREHRGYHYEAAEASFELLLRRESGSYQPLFKLEGFRVITDKREDGKVQTEATIKVWVDGERYVRTAEGNGPVNALDKALRDAIMNRHPHLADIELTNYKVRILDEHHGTGAVTRVLLDSSDGERGWGSIGVSENIIEASWEALVDSLEYAFQPRTQGSGRAAAERTATRE
ncbi:MAG: citramalate synthase [Actinomycetota bacterium]|nr:citramalate synthase [Actinomycetota bacterium]